MSLPYPVPPDRPIPWDIGYGTGFEEGWAVWSLQRAVNRFHDSWNDVENTTGKPLPERVEEDYVFDDHLEEQVKRIQALTHTVVDGVAGMTTQRRIVKYFTGDMPKSWNLVPSSEVYKAMWGKVPKQLLYSISYGEMIALLGGTSWNSETNIDCGAFQENLQDDQIFQLSAVQHAFDIRYQVAKKYRELVAWYDENGHFPGCSPKGVDPALYPERIWRRAAMAHNRPLDAAVLARFPLDQLDSEASDRFEKQWVTGNPEGVWEDGSHYHPSPWNEPLQWVIDRGVKIQAMDNKLIQTRLEWCRFYSLGFGTKWPGLVCKWVKDWGPSA